MSSLHQHAKDVFLEALARPANEREGFLAQACGTDRALREVAEHMQLSVRTVEAEWTHARAWLKRELQ